jgi:pimeloyl-ACP methyl ester carboxylesterase
VLPRVAEARLHRAADAEVERQPHDARAVVGRDGPGAVDGTVVDDHDVAKLRELQPNARVELVEGAGHSIQGDRPIELARLLVDFLPS